MALLSSTTPIAFIYGTDKSPLEANVFEVIDDFLVLINGKRDFLLAGGFADLESVDRRGDFSTEIKLGSLENLVDGKPRIFLNDKFGLRRNRAEKVDENGREEGDEFGGEEFVGDGTDEHHGGGEGGIGGEDGRGGLGKGHLFEVDHVVGKGEEWGMRIEKAEKGECIYKGDGCVVCLAFALGLKNDDVEPSLQIA